MVYFDYLVIRVKSSFYERNNRFIIFLSIQVADAWECGDEPSGSVKILD